MWERIISRQTRDVWKRLFRRKSAGLGLAIIVGFLILAVLAPYLNLHSHIRGDFRMVLQAPQAGHWLGTDEMGRDLLSRMIWGSRISLTIGVISVIIGAAVGVPVGAISGYYGGKVDIIVQRFIDIMLAFPGILLAIILVSVLGVGLNNVMIAVGVVSIPKYARLVRGTVLQLKERDFVSAAKAIGRSDAAVVFRHIVPNCMGPILVQSTLLIASSILWAAGLGFLGLGAQPPTPEWGTILSRGRDYLMVAPHISTFPGIAIMLVVLGFNLLGDGLRDALDPLDPRT